MQKGKLLFLIKISFEFVKQFLKVYSDIDEGAMLQNPPNAIFAKENNSILVMRNIPQGISSKILIPIGDGEDKSGLISSIIIGHLNLVKILLWDQEQNIT